jgi:transcriptional regulator with GAF, ATPase, and Fis domain
VHVQLHVWREASRHIEISAFVDRIVELVGRRLPADLLLVRRIEPEHARIETVAVGRCTPIPLPDRLRTACSAEDIHMLRTWSRWGAAYHAHTTSGTPLVALAAPPGVEGDVLAGPLVDERGTFGMLVLVASAPRTFTAEHKTLVESLLEPFTAALANDRRLHELARLREAAEAENLMLRSRLGRQSIEESVIGAAGGLRVVMERIEQVAPTDAPVLILGETGSGKEVVAQTIHARSSRALGPMVRVNCGAIPPELVDSELFGHERGSFTGAIATRKGWFERADGGTLFLDEVGELPQAAQVRLLRILQDGTFERVGGQRMMNVDVRIIAATNKHLEQMVAAGTFRQDLLYRLAVFPIALPPLRERMQDIPALAAHFAREAGRRLTGVPLRVSREEVELLSSYAWPGNVRELLAVIERAAILGGGRRLEIASSIGGALRQSPVRGASADLSADAPQTASHSDQSEDGAALDAAMVRHIEEVLARTKGRIEGPHGAAAVLRINPHTLRTRMRKLGIDWARFRRNAAHHACEQ